MPIKIPRDLPAFKVLSDENIFVMNNERAGKQDIRPLKIAILNLMPKKIQTENQLLRYLSNTPLQVEITLLQTESYKSTHTSFKHMDKFYSFFNDVRDEKFDALVITGAPVEQLEFEEVMYWEELKEIMEWSKSNVFSTLHICWGAQAGLSYHYGIPKYQLKEKMFGVFQHYINDKNAELTRGLDDKFYAPHSRHTEVKRKDIEKVPELEILSESDEAGIFIVANKNRRQIFITGHLEYDRDTLKEESVVKELYKLGFENANNSFVLLKDDDYIFQFFKKDILSLQKIGEVYYSESFTGIKSISKGSFKGDIRKGKYNYFELNFSIKGLENEEILSILKAFRDNKKYYKLKTGEFLDLEEIELKKFLKLLESLEGENKIEENKVSFPKSKGIYLEKYLEEEKMKNFRGRKELKSLKNMLLNLDNINFNIPKNLNGVLRNYQEKGFKWLNTLDYLGFGGILGDEMGLGKTFQTIAFLLSKENSISLIVAPTSLVFNWYSEFKKFAPSLKVVMVNKSPSEREEIIKDYKKYDILITTYNLVKRDLESYKKIFFHYVILDEAQNIKNPSSQNAKSVKELKSKNRSEEHTSELQSL